MIDPSRGRHLVLLAGFEGDQRLQVIAEHLGGNVLQDGELGQA